MGNGELVGLGAFLGAVIELLKKYGVIPDGYGGLAAAVANVIVYAVWQIAVGFYGADLSQLDSWLGMLAQLLLSIFASVATHKVGREMELPVFRRA